MVIIEIKFIQTPFLNISSIFKKPDPKTTASGGVDIGSMNAHEAAKVAATSKTVSYTHLRAHETS